MNIEQQIEIPLNKRKIIVMLLGCMAFVAIGVWFVFAPPKIDNSFWGNPTRLAIVGYAAIIIFGLFAIFYIRKLPDRKPGLIINDKGLFDNSGALSIGLILWTDIEDIYVFEIHSQKLLMLKVRNPQDYIDRQNGFLKRKTMIMNYKSYGSPLSITTNGLDIDFEKLFNLVSEKFQDIKTER